MGPIVYGLYFARVSAIEIVAAVAAVALIWLCWQSRKVALDDLRNVAAMDADDIARRDARKNLRGATGRLAIGVAFLILSATAMTAPARIPPQPISIIGALLFIFIIAVILFMQARDVQDRRLSVAELLAQYERREAQAAGVITIDRHSVVYQFNAAAERIFGYPAESMIGQSMTRLIPERFREAHLRGVARAYRASEPSGRLGVTLDLPGLRADGTEIPLHIVLHQTRGIVGKMFVAVFTEAAPEDRQIAQLAAVLDDTAAAAADTNATVHAIEERLAATATRDEARLDRAEAREERRDERAGEAAEDAAAALQRTDDRRDERERNLH